MWRGAHPPPRGASGRDIVSVPMAASLDFQALFTLSPTPYMLVDRELRCVAANEAYLRVTASRLEDLLGRNVSEAFPHEPEDPNNRSTLRYWSATHTPILDERGEVAFILQHLVDVRELDPLKQAVGTAAAAQDFNNLLQVIGDNLQRLQQDVAGNERAQQRLQSADVERGEQRTAAAPAPTQAGALRILLVEDDEDIRLSVSELIQEMGHTVRDFPSAEAALEALATSGFDVLLTDLSLPGLSGLELARQAVRLHPGLRIIIASGYELEEGSQEMVPGAVVLPKPYTLDQLKRALGRVS